MATVELRELESTADKSDNNETSGCSVGRALCRCCQLLGAFLRSSLSLSVVFVAYSIGGAFLFQELERRSELDWHNNTLRLIQDHVHDIVTATGHVTSSNITEEVGAILRRFQQHVQLVAMETVWKFEERSLGAAGYAWKWSFPGSLLYSVSVITTVGCGDQTPQTVPGRLLTLPYAALGIPLTFYFLSRAGRDLARLCRSLYRRVCCDLLCCKSCQRRQRLKIYASVAGSTTGVVYQRTPDGASISGVTSFSGEPRQRASHVYESITETQLARYQQQQQQGYPGHLAVVKSKSDPAVIHQAATLPRTAAAKKSGSLSDNQEKLNRATTIPNNNTQNRTRDLQELEQTSKKKLHRMSLPSEKVNAAYVSDSTTAPDVRYYVAGDVTHRPSNQNRAEYSRGVTTGKSHDDEKYRGNLRRGSLVTVGRRSMRRHQKLATGSGRRTSVVTSRRPYHGRSGQTGSRIPPNGLETTRSTPRSVGECLVDLVCLQSGGQTGNGGGTGGAMDRQGSDESFVTASNATPLLSRSFFHDPDVEMGGRSDVITNDASQQPRTTKPKARRRQTTPRQMTSSVPTQSSSAAIVTSSEATQQSEVECGTLERRRFRPDVDYYDVRPRSPTTVPLPVSFSILAVYLLCGAALFSQLYGRQSRDWVAGTYTSFVALVAVGGWYPAPEATTMSVGGTSVSGLSWPPDARFVYVVWLVVGLALVATCCTLVIERISHVTNSTSGGCCSCCCCCSSQ